MRHYVNTRVQLKSERRKSNSNSANLSDLVEWIYKNKCLSDENVVEQMRSTDWPLRLPNFRGKVRLHKQVIVTNKEKMKKDKSEIW